MELVRILAGGPRASPTQTRKFFLKPVGEGLKVNRPKAERSHPGVCPRRPYLVLAPSVGRAVSETFCGEFRRLRAATYFAHGGKVGKTPPGDAANGHFVPIGPLTPGPPFTGDALLIGYTSFSARKI